MPEHSTITDPDLHEPKGVAAATSGQVYVANGAGSGVWQTLSQIAQAANVVYVNSSSDLPAVVAGEHPLAANTTYVIGANITLSDSLKLASGTAVVGTAAFGVVLKTTATTSLFTGVSGNCAVDRLQMAAPNGKLFDLTDSTPGTSIFSLTNFACLEYKEIGTFTDLLGVQLAGGNFIDATNSVDGMTFAGSSWSVISVRQIFATTANAAYVGIDFGTAVSPTIEVTDYSISGVSGSIALKGAASNANVSSGSVATVTGCTLTGGGATALSGITRDDFRWDFTGNSGVANTRPDALLSMQGNATATTISAANTPVLTAGTWVDEGSSHYTSTTGGRSTYNGERNFTTPVTARLSIEPSAGTNKTLSAYVAINGTVIADSKSTIQADAGSPQNISVVWQYDFAENDYLEVFVENNTDTTDILVSSAIIRIN